MTDDVQGSNSAGSAQPGTGEARLREDRAERQEGERRPLTVSDYERAMTERNQHARARGLSAPYIPGGEDPDPEATRRREQPYVRLLLLMVAGIIVGGFALSIIGLIVLGNGAPP